VLGYGCTQQTLTWDPSSDPNFPQADLYYEGTRASPGPDEADAAAGCNDAGMRAMTAAPGQPPARRREDVGVAVDGAA
jgi:hypothetical protein